MNCILQKRMWLAGASLLAIVLGSGDANAVVFGADYIIPTTGYYDFRVAGQMGEDFVSAEPAPWWAASCSSRPAMGLALSWAEAAATAEADKGAMPVAEAGVALSSVAVVCCLPQAAARALILGRYRAALE